ncbi:MAG: stage II sporulation protein P [Clostridiales bacterium]|nr:stage II sporulation protein P [Clostridiales bacterium]
MRVQLKGRLGCLLAVLIIAASVIYSNTLSGGIAFAALFSARAAMPQAALANLRNEAGDTSVSGALSAVKDEQGAYKSESKPSALLPVYSPLAAVPDDILSLMESANEMYSSFERSGNINERQYTAADASSVYENIAVRSSSATYSVNIKNELETGTDLTIADKSQPCVLIYHTHATEGFELLSEGWYSNSYDSRTADVGKNIVRVGKEIASQLEKSGYKVIHDESIYDTSYSGAYARSAEAVKAYLAKYPGIKITLDIHRDAIKLDNGTKLKPTAVINGKKAAQIMIISGCEEGSITDFPEWRQNFRFALRLHQACENEYGGIMRPIMFGPRRYNMNLTPWSLLVEFGTDANTLDEAAYSGRLFGDALAKLLDTANAV